MGKVKKRKKEKKKERKKEKRKKERKKENEKMEGKKEKEESATSSSYPDCHVILPRIKENSEKSTGIYSSGVNHTILKFPSKCIFDHYSLFSFLFSLFSSSPFLDSKLFYILGHTHSALVISLLHGPNHHEFK
jgi:hypothetical protein